MNNNDNINLNLQGELNDLLKVAINSGEKDFKAELFIYRTDKHKANPSSIFIPLEKAKEINQTRLWDDIKDVLGDIYGDDIKHVILSIPLNKPETYFQLTISPDGKTLQGILGPTGC